MELDDAISRIQNDLTRLRQIKNQIRAHEEIIQRIKEGKPFIINPSKDTLEPQITISTLTKEKINEAILFVIEEANTGLLNEVQFIQDKYNGTPQTPS